MYQVEKSGTGAEIIKQKYIKHSASDHITDDVILEEIQDHLYPHMTEFLLRFVLKNKFNVSQDRVPVLIDKIKKKYGEQCISVDTIHEH